VHSPGTGHRGAIAPIPLIRGAAAAVLAASLAAGVVSIARDLRVAFREAGPSNVPASIRRQIELIQKSVPPGEPILLVSATLPDELWYTRLLQRALYPRNAIIIRYQPLAHDDAASLRRRWSIRHGIALDASPPDIGFRDAEDLGSLPALSHRVWLGELAPP
jgi:hypothetical protein